MSSYGDDKKLNGLDRRGVGWHSAGYGIGMLAGALFVAITGGSLLFAAIMLLIGAPLFAYGLRNP
jgi:hypothetical protein